ncbi:NAD(P)-dependent oxidoreductase [Aurantimonas sp. VKM B-3413]|uniref:NAD(P)-dependent oxidoreductase n=1 Tax=Aurantimonas sp. VKM B-3413 TaxID=2779401 RepID=UPI001E2A3D3D|nr:NAD(P)-dependent oxidoreductase [Aurantimonas sp. VKM B-3413]MCB8839940.1 NAD(P)-dependent oxidoreductase [Aurantimonas sp. VKM B-3413]
MRVGFAGLGRMGALMAENVTRAGFKTVVWNRNREKAERLAERTGAGIAASPRELCERTEIVLTMLADDGASETVHCARDGLFSAATGARHFLEMGTMSPDHIAALRERSDGRRIIDAPVSGATDAAREAKLMIMVGADAETIAPFRGVLDAMSRKVVCLDRPGAGAVMKLAINALIHGLNQTLAEALNVAVAAGISAERAFDAIDASAAAAPVLSYRRPLFLDDEAHPVSFTIALAHKDLDLFAELAAEHGVSVPQAELNRDCLEDAAADGFAEADLAAMVRYMRGRQ